MKKNAVIIGATGFGGLGLIELILKHPNLEIKQLIARQDVGVPVSDIFPHLKGYFDMKVDDFQSLDYDNIDIAFLSTPDRAGMTMIENFHSRNIPVIDFSGDFRFNTEEEYRIYASNKGMDTVHKSPAVLNDAVYGLPEINKDEIKNARIVGNPGCLAVSMTLGLLPLVDKNIITPGTIVCDGKTGVSGAGKNPGSANFYPQRYEDINTYREGHHQHVVEVENILNKRNDNDYKVFFIPQVVPMNRGILTTMYADYTEKITTEELIKIYEDYYKNDPFVVITDKSPHTTDVRGTNRCEIRPMVDERTGKIFVTSVIDNLLKGQSGNAIQNANIMLNLPETTGIDNPGFYP